MENPMRDFPVSLFKGYTDTCPTETSVALVAETIRTSAVLAGHTERHRQYVEQGKASAASREKRACPCFAVSVRFAGGKGRDNIREWTSLCMADFDHIPAERLKECAALACADPHTLLAYTTVSGQGLRIVSLYAEGPVGESLSPERLHALAFTQMNGHYSTLLGHPYDEKCKNPTRLSGLAYDPDVYFNPQAEPFVVNNPATVGTRPAKRTTARRLDRVVQAAEQQLQDEGLAYEPHHHNEYVMRMGYLLNAYGVDMASAINWATGRFADYDGSVESVIRSCYQRVEEFGSRRLATQRPEGAQGRNAANVADIEAFLGTQGCYRKNAVTGKCEIAPDGSDHFEDLTDRHVNSLWCRMAKEGKPVRVIDLRNVLESDFVELYNPFTQYFNSLPSWDGTTDHIAKLASQVHVHPDNDPELFVPLFRKWFVAMTASLLHEDTVNHEILVLIGKQGIYKSTWLNYLLPPQLRRYFYLKSNSRNMTKDDVLTLSEYALVCLEELDEMDAKDLNQLKALTTMRQVNERAAYAHYKEVRAHIASFCGTGNHTHFLTDLSGNRRWMPFEVESIDEPQRNRVDYEKVYAQAFALAEGGFHFWLEPDELRALNRHNRHFEVPCLEQELIQTYYRRPMPGERGIFATNAQILSRIGSFVRQKLSPVKIGIIMKQEGYEIIRTKDRRGYRVVELDSERVYHNRTSMAAFQ